MEEATREVDRFGHCGYAGEFAHERKNSKEIVQFEGGGTTLLAGVITKKKHSKNLKTGSASRESATNRM